MWTGPQRSISCTGNSIHKISIHKIIKNYIFFSVCEREEVLWVADEKEKGKIIII